MLCVLIRIASLESPPSPHGGDSNEYTQYTIFSIKKKVSLNYLQSAVMGFFNGLKNEFERAVVNESSVFEPLKFYCTYYVYLFYFICFLHFKTIGQL